MDASRRRQQQISGRQRNCDSCAANTRREQRREHVIRSPARDPPRRVIIVENSRHRISKMLADPRSATFHGTVVARVQRYQQRGMQTGAPVVFGIRRARPQSYWHASSQKRQPRPAPLGRARDRRGAGAIVLNSAIPRSLKANGMRAGRRHPACRGAYSYKLVPGCVPKRSRRRSGILPHFLPRTRAVPGRYAARFQAVRHDYCYLPDAPGCELTSASDGAAAAPAAPHPRQTASTRSAEHQRAISACSREQPQQPPNSASRQRRS